MDKLIVPCSVQRSSITVLIYSALYESTSTSRRIGNSAFMVVYVTVPECRTEVCPCGEIDGLEALKLGLPNVIPGIEKHCQDVSSGLARASAVVG